MSKKEEKMNLYYFDNEEINKETIEEMMQRKKIKEREKRIKENKQEQENKDIFDFDTETVIGMTNKNKVKKEEENRKKFIKEQRRKEKKRKKIKRIIRWTSFIILLVGTIVFALTSPIFNIKTIEVINNNRISSETIISLSELSTNQNIFKFISSQIINKIKENAYIEKVKINRKLPDRVQIEVEERTPKYSVPILGNFAYINSQGYILEITQNELNLPIINGVKTTEENITVGNRIIEEDLEILEIILKISDICKENNLENKFTSIDISNKNDYIIYIKEEEKYIHLGDGTNLTNKMLYIVSIIEEEKGTPGDIFANGDLNDNFKVYFKPKIL